MAYLDGGRMRKGIGMNRSGSQKALLVVSIIELVFGAISLLGGIMLLIGGAAIGGAAAAGGDPELTAQTAGAASAVTSLGALLLFVSAGLAILEGVLGIRAANDNQKIMPVWILAIISLVLAVIGVIGAIANGSFGQNAMSNILGLALNAVMFWVANNIKTEAGK